MRVFLVTGVPGAGKSSVAYRLRDGGHHAVSLDAEPGLCRWTDRFGRRVEPPDEPDAGWLAVHRWSWDPQPLHRLVAEVRASSGAGAAWLCGYAANARQHADRFDGVVLLDIDRGTMLDRLRSRTGGNVFGRTAETQQAALDYFAEYVEPWRRRGAVAVDATRPIDTVVADVLRVAAAAGPRHPADPP